MPLSFRVSNFPGTNPRRHWQLPLVGLAWLGLIIFLESLLLSLLTGRLVNHAASPLLDMLGWFGILWQQNALEAWRQLLAQPVLVLAHLDPASQNRLWSLHYLPGSLLQHGLTAVLLAVVLRRTARWTAAAAVTTGMAVSLSLFSALYLIIATHCATPTWALEVLLRELALPDRGGFNYLAYLPEDPELFFSGAQTSLFLLGTAVLSLQEWHRSAANSSQL